MTDLLHSSADPAQVVSVGVAGGSLGQQVLKVALILGQPLDLQREKRESAAGVRSHERVEKGGRAYRVEYVIEITAE